ncbi:MAG: hypothetical protein V3W04_05260 [Gammaproteobacteria bacterium]
MDSKLKFLCAAVFLIFQLAGCGGGGSEGGVVGSVSIAKLPQLGDTESSQPAANYNPAEIIAGGSSAGGITVVGLARDLSVELNYMVNKPDSLEYPETKGLIVLLSGGYMDTRLTEASISKAFLPRSAHLFAAQGYEVVTLERPSNYSQYLLPDSVDPENLDETTNSDETTGDQAIDYAWFDQYLLGDDLQRDLREIINAATGAIQNPANSDDIPVFLIGYGRGAIGAAANYNLTDPNGPKWSVHGVAFLSPAVTVLDVGSFLGDISDAAVFSKPVYVVYHNQDACLDSSNSDASNTAIPGKINDLRQTWINNGFDFEMVAVQGGFELNESPCHSLTHHGYLGVEYGTASLVTDWADSNL